MERLEWNTNDFVDNRRPVTVRTRLCDDGTILLNITGKEMGDKFELRIALDGAEAAEIVTYLSNDIRNLLSK